MGFYANRMFPWIMDFTEPDEMPGLRALALHDVHGDVLEIGLGTGANLPYYPDHVTKVAAVEPSGGMHARAAKRMAETGRAVERHASKGEELPFDDGTFDSVVATLLLCSVDSVDAVLKEAFRVLKPGGQYHFIEHVVSKEPTIRKWQFRLNGISKVIACGCQLVRDTGRHLRDSEFDLEEVIEVPQLAGFDKKLFPLIRGVAAKPS